MSDWLKIFGEMSLDNLFVIAGLAFLAVGIIGKISGKIDPTPRARFVSAIVGVCLVVSGVWIHRGHANSASAPQQSESGRVPQVKEVQAHENPARNHATDEGNRPHHQGLAYFAGRWKNTDANTKGLTALNVRASGESVWVHAWGACHPTECDWGEVSGTPFAPGVSDNPTNDAQKVTAVFETSFSNTLLTLTPADDDQLAADTQTRFTDNSGRSSYSATYTFRH